MKVSLLVLIFSCLVGALALPGCGKEGTVADELGTGSESSFVTDTGSDTLPADTVPEDSGSVTIPQTDSEEVETASQTETAPPSCEAGQEAACSSVDPGYPHGTATCGEDGAWDLSACWYGDAFTEPGGQIDPGAEVKISYILNGARMEDQMYILQHQTHVLPRAVFKGEHLGKAFPPKGVSLTYGWRVDMGGEPGILVLQMTNQGITPQSPMVQMIFLTDDLAPGEYLMGENVVASVIEVDAKTQSQCVAGVAYGGTVVVTAAKNTTKLEGGTVSFALPHELHLYHPSDTTLGDLSGTFEGIDVCD